jgi:hypothetical protein
VVDEFVRAGRGGEKDRLGNGGTFADGSRGGLLGTPNLEVGQEVFLILRYAANGDPYVVPTPLAGNGVYRIVPLANGSTAVVDGRGILQVRGPLGKPLFGPRIPEAVSNWPLSEWWATATPPRSAASSRQAARRIGATRTA